MPRYDLLDVKKKNISTSLSYRFHLNQSDFGLDQKNHKESLNTEFYSENLIISVIVC